METNLTTPPIPVWERKLVLLLIVLAASMSWMRCDGAKPNPNPLPRATPTLEPTATLPPAETPTAAPTTTAYISQAPEVTMKTSGIPATNGKIEITEHFKVNPDPRVLGEIPSREEAPGFWRGCDEEGNCGVINCDPEHFFYPDGEKTINWWNCGGSVKFHTEPRRFDLAGPFKVTATSGVSIIYGRVVCDGNGAEGGGCTTLPGCNPKRNDWFNLCYSGKGEVTVCVPIGGRTADGLLLRVSERCGTWPVQ